MGRKDHQPLIVYARQNHHDEFVGSVRRPVPVPGSHAVPVVSRRLIAVMPVRNKDPLVEERIRHLLEHRTMWHGPERVMRSILEIKGEQGLSLDDFSHGFHDPVFRVFVEAEDLAELGVTGPHEFEPIVLVGGEVFSWGRITPEPSSSMRTKAINPILVWVRTRRWNQRCGR